MSSELISEFRVRNADKTLSDVVALLNLIADTRVAANRKPRLNTVMIATVSTTNSRLG